ncbi:MAG: TIGR00282 family metallophosphoesterase [Candidatus Omnitrophica bacterium]|nr:TIGR00282 family metallophosphoesterase [Candidatus Omnitrophota bacterium]
MNILILGDVVGKPGRDAIAALLPQIIKKHKIDFTIVNIENAAGGAGITPKVVDELSGAGVDVLTTGDHIWDRREILDIVDIKENLLRPANYPDGTPGKGYCVIEKDKNFIGVLNVQGRVFMKPAVDCPFKKATEIIAKIKTKTPIIIVDMHAEATSEKIALGHFLDGQVSAVVGTHTHVQTADEKILPQGTAYITDIGMCGPCDSVIGQRKEKIIERFLTSMPLRFEVASEDVQLQGAIIEIDEKSGKAKKIERIIKKVK